MSETILITGGSGLIGRPLTRALLQKGYTIHHLSRNPELHGNPKIKIFKWDIEKGELDDKCPNGVETIIHLAGEGIAEKRWTKSRKESIIKSRTGSIRLIYKHLRKNTSSNVKTIISASGIGYYGDRNDEILIEDSKPGDGFLPKSCIEWENAVDEGAALGLRIVKFRTGIVLTDEGGALPEMAGPIKKGFGSPLGTGKQWMSWIHIKDVVKMYLFAVEAKELAGTYNMVTPTAFRNEEFTKTLAAVLDKPFWMPNVPKFALNLLLGEMSALVLDSANVSAEKILRNGFQYDYPELKSALEEIYIE